MNRLEYFTSIGVSVADMFKDIETTKYNPDMLKWKIEHINDCLKCMKSTIQKVDYQIRIRRIINGNVGLS